MKEYEEMEDPADVLLLVKLSKKIVYNFEIRRMLQILCLKWMLTSIKYCQVNDVSNDDYYQEFQSYTDVIY